MMTDYWVKLYIEILEDPKMATLPDRLWRRCIELFLIAGRINSIPKDGIIPDAKQIAWILRLNADDIELDLRQLEMTGIIRRQENGWLIVNFAKRQAAVSDADRKRYERSRKRHEEYTGNVTNVSRNVREIRSETETETEADTDQIRDRSQTIDPYINMVMRNTGIMATANDLKVIVKWENDGVTEEDIKDAIQWRIDQKLTPVKTIAHLQGCVEMSRLKRIQGGNGKAAQPQQLARPYHRIVSEPE